MILIDTAVAFGGVGGCGTFGKVADMWKEIMGKEFDVLKIFRWVDDNLFIKQKDSTLKMIDVVNRSLQLGVATNISKLSQFDDEQKFIGSIWNGRMKTVQLPEDKLQIRRKQIEEALAKQEKFSKNEVEVLTGRLNHVTLMLPQLKCYMTALYRWQKSWVKERALRTMPEDAQKI